MKNDTWSADNARLYERFITPLGPGEYEPDSERVAVSDIEPKGFFIRHPPNPHDLIAALTPDTQLFQTIHMGAAVVDKLKWRLIIDGLVNQPIQLSWEQLRKMPRTSVTSFHECYGSPILPPTSAVWRIGNVTWTGVRLKCLLDVAQPRSEASYVWSDGLDSGTFADVWADRYQKDLPITKAMAPEVLLAYEMNGIELTKERGGPVRLIVPGWFGTNSTKWICHISLQSCRSSSPYTTIFYNEVDPTDCEAKRKRPVWEVEPNSIIVRPVPGEIIRSTETILWGRSWGCQEIIRVEVTANDGDSWVDATVEPRKQFEWQLFRCSFVFPAIGRYQLKARATDRAGIRQPPAKRRNHVHTVEVEVVSKAIT